MEKKMKRLEKAGYKTKKGQFGAVKSEAKKEEQLKNQEKVKNQKKTKR